MWFLAAAKGHEASHVHARSGLLQQTVACQFCQTLPSSSGIELPLSCLSHTEAPLYQMCSCSMDTRIDIKKKKVYGLVQQDTSCPRVVSGHGVIFGLATEPTSYCTRHK